jgi:hypothetical protein
MHKYRDSIYFSTAFHSLLNVLGDIAYSPGRTHPLFLSLPHVVHHLVEGQLWPGEDGFRLA